MWKEMKIILFAMIILTSCQNNQDKTMNTLKINFQEGDLPSLHPHALMIYLRGISLAKNLYECLTRIDSNGQIKFAGAESVDISPDQLHYTFTLRDNRWSDGTPVTAFQYESAWKEALSPTSSCSRADLLYMIKNAEEVKKGLMPPDSIGVKALDEKTLVVELAYPSPYFLELVAQPITAPLVSLEKKDLALFNGPFLVDAWKHGDYLKLKPNPYYWDRKNIALKQIDIYMIQDAMTAYSMFEKKQIDWIGMPLSPLSSELIGRLKTTGSLKSHPVDRAFWVFLNTQRQSLSSASIRRALSLAIDRSAITEHILIGGQPLSKPFPYALLPLHASSTLKKDLSEARQSFEQGLRELGMTKETMPSLVISYSQQANRKQLAEYLQQIWSEAFGIQVRLESQEWNVLRCNLEKGDYEISGCFEAAFYKDPLEILEKLVAINSNNFPKWLCAPFIEKVALAKRQSDPKYRMHLLSEAEHILMEQMPFIPICSDELIFSHTRGLHGYAFDYVGAIDFSHASFTDGRQKR
jgi:oligopeptide transport system substrate-binding protein